MKNNKQASTYSNNTIIHQEQKQQTKITITKKKNHKSLENMKLKTKKKKSLQIIFTTLKWALNQQNNNQETEMNLMKQTHKSKYILMERIESFF